MTETIPWTFPAAIVIISAAIAIIGLLVAAVQTIIKKIKSK